ncbi:5-oxoprolinase subunit C family protein [Agrilutibacter solisilvae]|uniref:Biotin-dependent carboxyltransferase family protein n=1 Tax=Agrilutibacter solisilvae TaxID=2763317 RepID=A0A974XWW4_9GAMM|nr:biotin-dependent carboxyltransferase family protein [Lysobacter solisilvae]QSX77351.1 biotin-dependent carboxyltransferase family protein [Lysobacter solisilvae]
MSLHVLQPGLLTTVQDRGRHGWRHLGIARAGALDPDAAALANRLVGNDPDAAVLEMTLQGPTLRFDVPTRIALCGAWLPMKFTSSTGVAAHIPGGRPVSLPAGELSLGAACDGTRAWLAIGGGLDVPPVLGSRSTDLRGGFGGLAGRALRAGDRLHVSAAPDPGPEPRFPAWWVDPLAHDRQPHGRAAPIRYVPAHLPGADAFARMPWRASARSDRQGLRLDGEALSLDTHEQISAPVAPGTVQLPPDGRPIVLLADAQTVGGYPRLGHVIAVDLQRLAQLRPGQPVHFSACDARTATQLACAARARLARITLMIDFKLQRGYGE